MTEIQLINNFFSQFHIECTLDNCEECTGQRTCTKCKADMALYKTFMKSVICVNLCPLGNKEVTNQDGLKVCEKNDVTTSQPPATVTESSTKSMYDTILLSREYKRNSQRK